MQHVSWTADVEAITPEIAKALLATNNGNRRLRTGVVTRYADTIRRGEWMLTPEPIIIANTGRLLNGQHRLHALILADTTVLMFVVRGVPEQAFPAIDRGVTRSFADANQVEKYLAESAKLLVAILENTQAAAIDSKVLLEVDFLREHHTDLIAACPTQARVFSTSAFRLAASIWMFEPTARDHVKKMYADLIYANMSELPPIALAMVGAVASGRLEQSHNGNSDFRRSMVLRAFNMFNPANAKMTRLPILTDKTLDRFFHAVAKAKAKTLQL